MHVYIELEVGGVVHVWSVLVTRWQHGCEFGVILEKVILYQ